MQRKKFTIDRYKASKLLQVSVRTIDRYITRGKLSAKLAHGRVWLNKEELGMLARAMMRPAKNLPRLPEVRIRKFAFETPKSKGTDPHIYQDLYQQVFGQLSETKKELEMANYRLNQFESKREEKLILPPATATRNLLSEPNTLNDLQSLQNQLKKERLNRIMLSIILYILLILQPVFWYLLS